MLVCCKSFTSPMFTVNRTLVTNMFAMTMKLVLGVVMGYAVQFRLLNYHRSANRFLGTCNCTYIQKATHCSHTNEKTRIDNCNMNHIKNADKIYKPFVVNEISGIANHGDQQV